MRAAFIDKPFSISFIDDAPEPQITASNQVKIRVIVTGICGSEVHAFHGTHPFRIPPLVSGHEMAGVVVETGEDVTDFKQGDRVTVEPHYGCGRCFLCRDGAYNICAGKSVLGAKGWSGSFGEYIVVPQQTVLHIPDELSFEEGALIEPIAVGMHAVRISGLSVGDCAVVAGCGPIGLGVIMCAKLAGASKIIASDVLGFNLDKAKKMGATHLIQAANENLCDSVREITQGKGADVSFLAFATTQLFDDVLEATRRGGLISKIAITNKPYEILLSKLQQKEISLQGSNMYVRRDYELVIDAILQKKIDVSGFISGVMPVEKVVEAMEIVDKKTDNVIKMLLKF